MKKAAQNAFTLIELLVVITVMAVIGIYTLANYKSFGEDQNLKNAVLDIQSLLRAAQTSATSNVLCKTALLGPASAYDWVGAFYKDTDDSRYLKTFCEIIRLGEGGNEKISVLPTNIVIERVCGNDLACQPSPIGCKYEFTDNSNYVAVLFKTLSGEVNFFHTDISSCFNDKNITNLTVVVKNTKNNNTKNLTIEKGGRIYGQ